jgi:nitrogen fixation NifU-like protein
MRYSKKVMEIFSHPKNMGEMKNPDGLGKVGNAMCGDIMWLYLRVSKERKGDVIRDIRVKTFGCIAAIVTSSMLAGMARGKTIEEAIKISRQDIVNHVGGLPQHKIHCSVLASSALREAIYDYLRKNNRPIPEDLRKQHEIAERITRGIENSHY